MVGFFQRRSTSQKTVGAAVTRKLPPNPERELFELCCRDPYKETSKYYPCSGVNNHPSNKLESTDKDDDGDIIDVSDSSMAGGSSASIDIFATDGTSPYDSDPIHSIYSTMKALLDQDPHLVHAVLDGDNGYTALHLLCSNSAYLKPNIHNSNNNHNFILQNKASTTKTITLLKIIQLIVETSRSLNNDISKSSLTPTKSATMGFLSSLFSKRNNNTLSHSPVPSQLPTTTAISTTNANTKATPTSTEAPSGVAPLSQSSLIGVPRGVAQVVRLKTTPKAGSIMALHLACRNYTPTSTGTHSYTSSSPTSSSLSLDIIEYLIEQDVAISAALLSSPSSFSASASNSSVSAICTADSTTGNLPVHEICIRCTTLAVPLEVLLVLLQQWPDSCMTRNLDGNLPLHLAVQIANVSKQQPLPSSTASVSVTTTATTTTTSTVEEEGSTTTPAFSTGSFDQHQQLEQKGYEPSVARTMRHQRDASSSSSSMVIEAFDGMDTVQEEDDDAEEEEETTATMPSTDFATNVNTQQSGKPSADTSCQILIGEHDKSQSLPPPVVQLSQEQCQLELVQYLTEYFPDALYVPNKYGYTPIQVAAASMKQHQSTMSSSTSSSYQHPVYAFLVDYSERHPSTSNELQQQSSSSLQNFSESFVTKTTTLLTEMNTTTSTTSSNNPSSTSEDNNNSIKYSNEANGMVVSETVLRQPAIGHEHEDKQNDSTRLHDAANVSEIQTEHIAQVIHGDDDVVDDDKDKHVDHEAEPATVGTIDSLTSSLIFKGSQCVNEAKQTQSSSSEEETFEAQQGTEITQPLDDIDVELKTIEQETSTSRELKETSPDVVYHQPALTELISLSYMSNEGNEQNIDEPLDDENGEYNPLLVDMLQRNEELSLSLEEQVQEGQVLEDQVQQDFIQPNLNSDTHSFGNKDENTNLIKDDNIQHNDIP